MTFSIQEIVTGKSELCRNTLDVLPEWFGLEAAKEDYIKESERFFMIGCLDNGTNKSVGFLSLKDCTPNASEIYVMGVHPDFHRRGVGALMVRAAEKRMKDAGKEFLFVRTLAPTRPDPFYARTRCFYSKLRFKALAVFPALWGEANPCLIMVKKLGSRHSTD